MSTDSPTTGGPKEEGTPLDAIKDTPTTRRASGARRSRRKKDEDENKTTTDSPKPKRETKQSKEAKEAKEAKEEKPKEVKEKPVRAQRRPREKSNATAASRKKPKLEQPEATPAAEAAAPTAATATPVTTATQAATPTPAAATNTTPAATSVKSPSPVQPQSKQSPQPPPQPAVPTPQTQAQPQQQQQQSQPPPQPAPVSTPSYPSSHHASPAPAINYPLAQSYQSRPHSQPPPPNPTHPPPRTSGQKFDPIRSAFDNPSPAPPYSPSQVRSPQNNYRASASPAISSIIDPPTQNARTYTPLQRTSSGHASAISSPVPTPTHPSLAPSAMPASSPSHGAVHVPPPLQSSGHYSTPYPPAEQRPIQSQPPQLELSPPVLQLQQSHQAQAAVQHSNQPQPATPVQSTPQRPSQQGDAMEIDTKEQKELPASSTKKEKGTGTAPSSKAPSPKPARPAKETPQLPQGSGLITNALFGMGGDDSAKSPDSRSTPNIVVHVPLSKGNQIVNFAQLAEEQYGFAALHPRLAAHKDRLARVAAAGAALERNDKGLTESAEEDLSLEADRDSDMDGDLAMGGTAPAANGAGSEAGDGKKKRRRKVEEYDRDDPFVDDSEMAWQEQAAASKDGFFVYMGPLVPEGDKVQVERADGTIKRGRGRGRGTGRARSLAAHPHVPIAAAVPISQDTGLPLRGPGSRGGTSRRARTTKKADQGEKHTSDRSGHTASASDRGGRGGNAGSRGGGTPRGGKATNPSMMHMMDLAPAPSPTSTPNLTPAPGPSPMAGPEPVMK